MSHQPIIHLRGCSKTFGTYQALDGIEIEIKPGEMTALIGPSGSGKSTLLRGLAQLVPFDRGSEMRVFGALLTDLSRGFGRSSAYRSRIGFVAQSYNLVGRLTLFSNVAVGGLGRFSLFRCLTGVWPKEHFDTVMAAIDRVGLSEFYQTRASVLSGGQQQRGAIARVIAQRAELVLADEPVAALDPVSGKRIMALLADLNAQEGKTIIVSLHNIAMAQRFCRRIVALHQGRIVFDGPPSDLDTHKLSLIYGPEIEDAL